MSRTARVLGCSSASAFSGRSVFDVVHAAEAIDLPS
ncbi:hypothetical protein BJ992_004915 [Sphaerisporangium rubeum]|uniref:Uncharacterized protein n=1 Tax=Sphaerisporangium rubeum TaxID=321317 RepID=A0A7X0IHS6_9ACTN|nr:hypothetical protein [Sphaerisporangium rubeum]